MSSDVTDVWPHDLGYPNYSSKNRKGDNLKRKGNESKGNENNLESTAFSFNSLIVTEWSLKIGGGEYNYFSKATE